MKTPYNTTIIILIAMSLISCGGGMQPNDNQTQLTDIIIFIPDGYRSPTTTEIFQLKATGIYSNKGDNEDITPLAQWLSDNTEIATVSSTGEVTAVSEGTVTIYAELDGASDKVTFDIIPPSKISSAEIKKMEGGYFIREKKTFTVTAIAHFTNEEIQENNHLFRWSSNNSNLASVDQNGKITGQAYGSASITAISIENLAIRTTILVTILPIATSISLPQEITYLHTGEKNHLIASLNMSDGSSSVAPTKVEWLLSPSDNIVSISPTGEVTASEPGIINATAKYQSFVASHTIVVEDPLNLYVIQDGNQTIRIAWHPRHHIRNYTITTNVTANESATYGNNSFEHEHTVNSDDPVTFQLTTTRVDGSTEVSAPIKIWPHLGSWQKLSEMAPRKNSATVLFNEKMYFFGGEITDQSGSLSRETWHYNLQNSTWNKETPLASSISHASACSSSDAIYIFGGINEADETLSAVHAYNANQNSWHLNISQIPSELKNSKCILLNNKIYITGGENDTGISDATYAYNPEENTWNTSLPRLNTARHSHSMASKDGTIVVSGGTTTDETSTTQSEALDTLSELASWSFISAMNTGRSKFSLHKWNNKLHAIGGKSNLDNSSTVSIETYDIELNSWTESPPLPFPAKNFTSAVSNNSLHIWAGEELTLDASEGQSKYMTYNIDLDLWEYAAVNTGTRRDFATAKLNNRLYIIGGSNPIETSNVSAYNTTNNTWENITPLPTPKTAISAVTIENISNSRIYVLGGSLNGIDLRSSARYNPKSELWEDIDNLKTGRSFATTSTIDEKIYIFGGQNGTSSRTFEVYDTGINGWISQSNMDKRRSHATSTVLHNKIYIIGGKVNGVTSKNVSIYTPDTDSWSETPINLSYERARAGSLQYNNRILLFGGFDSQGKPLNTIESYSGFTVEGQENPSWQLKTPALPSNGGYIQGAQFNRKLILISDERSNSKRENAVYRMN